MKQLRVGIIGQGRSGRDIHGAYLSKAPEKFRIAAVADPMEERLRRAEREYGCDAYSDYRDMFARKDLDFIVNATPSHLHAGVSMEFLNNGFNVLSEKPAARRAEDMDRLIDVSKRNGVVYAIFQNGRYTPVFRQVKKVIDAGVLGRVVQATIQAYNSFGRRWDWQTLQEFDGGSLLNTGPHPVDQALQLFGTDRMPEVFCTMDRVNSFGDAEDYVKLILRGKGRPLVDVEVSACCAYPCCAYQVQGTCGGLKAVGSHAEWKYFIPGEAPEQHLIRVPLEAEDGTPAYCSEKLKWYGESWDVPIINDGISSTSRDFYDMLYKTLAEGAPLEVTPQEVRQQIAVIEECHRQNPLPRL